VNPVAGEAGVKLLQHALSTAIDPKRGGGVEEGGRRYALVVV
jgi:hypothetical protein